MASRPPRRGAPGARPSPVPGLAVVVVALVVLLVAAPASSGAPVEPPGTAPAAVDPTARDAAARACLAVAGPRLPVEGDQRTPWPRTDQEVPAGTVVDARGRVFDNSALDRGGNGLGVKLRAGRSEPDVCLVGGLVRTGLDPESTAWERWHQITALTVESPRFTVVGTTFRNQGDAAAFISDADDWTVVGVRADGGHGLDGAFVHDDCVEDDAMHSGRILDSLFDGCASFLSATQSSPRRLDGGEDTVAVAGVLVRLQPYTNSFDVPKYGEGNHGGFFKWARTDSDVMVPPALVVTDSVFRADTPARYGGNENGFLGLPPGTRCERVVLIGTESWPADELASWTDQCVDLRLGTVQDWDAAVAAWEAAHPPLRDLPGRARDLLAPATGW